MTDLKAEGLTAWEERMIQKIRHTNWLRISDGYLLPIGSVQNEVRLLSAGGREYPFDDISMFNCGERISEVKSSGFLPTELQCIHSGWQKDTLLALRPLIFYTVSGSAELFEMAKLSLRTLIKNSGINTINVLVTTERDLSQVQSLFFCSDYRFDHVITVGDSGADSFTFARYAAFLENFLLFRNYSPIIYLDSDVLVDGSILNLCVTARKTDKIMLFPEGLALDARGWFGNNLLQLDETVVISDQDVGYNSGIIISNNAESMRRLCTDIMEVQKGILSNSPQLLTFYDQPLVNYIGRKNHSIDTTVLENFARVGSLLDPNRPAMQSCLIHFLGGVGEFQRKLPKMVEYVENMSL